MHAITEFLEIQPVTEYIGRGGAATAIVNNSASMYYNPAGLANTPNFNMSINYINWFDYSDIYYLSAAKDLSEYGNIGISLYRNDLGNQEMSDEFGNYIGTLHSYIDYLSFGYGLKIAKKISLGISSKIIKSKMYFHDFGEGTGNGYSVNIGLQITDIFSNMTISRYYQNIPFSSLPQIHKGKGLSLGACINNIGPELVYTNGAYTEKEKLLKTFRIGAGYNVFQSNLLSLQLSYDYQKEIENTDHLYSYNHHMFGGEITILNFLSIQKGKHNIHGPTDYTHTMFGLAIRYKFLQLNYSQFDFNDRTKMDNFGLSIIF